jgi:transcriptional regulator NrdR family protein
LIACPICGGRTQVVETRGIDEGTRRRRACVRTGLCPGKVTTVEVAVSATRGTSIGRVVTVPKRHLEKLRKIVAAIGGGAA